jgi:hypothetical protein
MVATARGAIRVTGAATQPAARRTGLVIFAILVCAALAVALLPGAAAIGLGALLAGAVVPILARPEAAPPIVVFLIYTNAVVVLVRFHGLPDVAALALPVALCAPFAWHLLIRRERVVATPALALMLAFLAVQLVSAAFSAYTANAVSAVTTYAVEGVALFVLVLNVFRSRTMILAGTWSIVAGAGVLGAISAYQEATGTYANAYLGFAQVKSTTGGFFTGAPTLLGRGRQPELSGPIGDSNSSAQIVLIALPLGVALIVATRPILPKLVAAGLSLLIAVGMVLTFSRGAALAAVLLVPLMLLLKFVRLRHLLAVALGSILVLAMVPEYAQRVATLDVLTNLFTPDGVSVQDGSLRSRATENLAAALVYIDHPILGVGPGQYPAYYRQYADQIGLEVQVADRQPHTLYLGIAAETGTPGLLLFLAILGTTLVALIRARRLALRSGDQLMATLGAGFILAVAGFMLTGVFLHLAFERYPWLILALANATAATTRAVHTSRYRVPLSPTLPAPSAVALPAPVALSEGSHPR